MNKLILSSAACAAMLLPEALLAHGGRYRGPGDVVPPNTGGGPTTGGPGVPGPTTPGPTAPGAPAPAGPVTPGPGAPPAPTTGGPAAPSAAAGPKTPGRGGIQLTADLSKWQFWWEFNKDPFINLKDAIHAPATTTGSDEFYMGRTRRVASKDTAKPSDSDIQETILPTLKRALENNDNRDILSSCMVALAKIGRNHTEWEILPIFEASLKKPDQEIRETAALAMGISAMEGAFENLDHLARDDAKGRKLVGKSQVDNRTRSFSLYGLGLIAHRSANIDLKVKIWSTLKHVLVEGGSNDRNIKVAAINSISLLNIPTANAGAKAQDLLKEVLSSLDTYYDLKGGRGGDLIKSHVNPAIAKLIGQGDSDLHTQYKDRFLAALHPKKKQGNDLYRGAALALGQLCAPYNDKKDEDAKYSQGLIKYFESGKDHQTKYFSLLALGQIGGVINLNTLRTVLRKGNKALERPWAAISLGINQFKRLSGTDAIPDADLGKQLIASLKSVKNPESRAAFAVSLGLCGYKEASSELMDMMMKYKAQDELAGYICIGLALMDYQAAKKDIHEIVKSSVRRPELLKQAAIALGKLGDKEVTNTLTEMLQAEDSNLAKLSAIAAALGYIGDRRTIQPLKGMLHNSELTPLSRAFAAVALGGVADKEKLPWNSKISRNMNYRGSVETLTGSGTGILDIL